MLGHVHTKNLKVGDKLETGDGDQATILELIPDVSKMAIVYTTMGKLHITPDHKLPMNNKMGQIADIATNTRVHGMLIDYTIHKYPKFEPMIKRIRFMDKAVAVKIITDKPDKLIYIDNFLVSQE